MRVEDFVRGARVAVDAVDVEATRALAQLIVEVTAQSRRVFLMGNGGSASLTSHFANDLTKGARVEGQPTIQATALTDNVPLLTAWANDDSYESAFARQLSDALSPDDLVIAVSTSGRSENIVRGAAAAREAGATVVALTCRTPGPLSELAHHWLPVETDSVPLGEAIFSLLMHAVAWEALAIREGVAADAAASEAAGRS